MNYRSHLAQRCSPAIASSLPSPCPRRAPQPQTQRRILLPGLLTIASLVGALPLHASNALPDWVHTAASQTLPSLPPSTKAVVLLDEETYTVAPDGRATIHVRQVTKILRPQGREYGLAHVTYCNDEKLLSFHVWSIDPAGHEYTVKDNEMIDLGAPAGGGDLYSDERARAAEPPGRDPGGIVAIEYEQRQRPYIAEADWFFQDELPRLNQSFTLALPPGYHFTASFARHDKVQPTELPNSALRWQVDHEPAIDLSEVPLAPSPGALASRMIVHYSGPGIALSQDGTWKGIGEWYEALSHDRVVSSPEIAAKAAELTAGKSDFYDKAEAIGEFVQKQIRYVEISMGVGGWQPHHAQDIFHGRYGDCKDKATLLSAMLSSVGIHSAIVLVDTQRGVIDPNSPSIIANHAIAAIELPDGYKSPKLRSVITAKTGMRYLIFDPTWDLTPFGQLESNLQGSSAVLVEGAASQLIQLPVLSPELNRIERSGTFSLNADGSLKGNVTEKRFGDRAETDRYVFALDEKQQQKYIDKLIARDFMSVSVTGVKADNVRALNQDVSLSYGLAAEHFGAATGPLLMVRPRVLGSDRMPIDRKQRKLAVDLGETMQAHDSFDIELPEGYTVDELPDPVKLDVGFATYESASEVHGHTLHYSRTYRINQVTLPPEKYPDLQKLVSLIANDEDSRAVLKRSN